MTTLAFALASALTLGAGSAQAATTITVYSDDFSGNSADNLNGTTPDTVSGDFGTSGATWNASTSFKADGSVPFGGGSSALLPFEPEAGWSYTLTVAYSNPTNGWYSMGFANGSATTSAPSSSDGLAHIISRNTGYHVMAGVGFDQSLASASFNSSPYTEYVLTLDATGGLDQVKVSASIGGTEVLTPTLVDYSSAGKGLIKYVQLSEGKDTGGGDYDSLTLTAVPEPSSFALLAGFMGLTWIMLRRRN